MLISLNDGNNSNNSTEDEEKKIHKHYDCVKDIIKSATCNILGEKITMEEAMVW